MRPRLDRLDRNRGSRPLEPTSFGERSGPAGVAPLLFSFAPPRGAAAAPLLFARVCASLVL